MTNVRIGVMYDRDWAPEGLPEFARRAEALGVDDLWVVEDLGWNGGVSAAAVALGATERLRVGIGITPAPLRSPALLAMELATLARVFPGRLVAGIGHGVREWMAQVGVAPRSPLALLEETITSVRALLRGERVEPGGARSAPGRSPVGASADRGRRRWSRAWCAPARWNCPAGSRTAP